MIIQEKAILISQYAELGTNECVFAREEVVEISYPVWYPDEYALKGYLEIDEEGFKQGD